MNFQPSEITQQVAETARQFAQQQIKPHLMNWDESQEFPLHIFKEMGNELYLDADKVKAANKALG